MRDEAPERGRGCDSFLAAPTAVAAAARVEADDAPFAIPRCASAAGRPQQRPGKFGANLGPGTRKQRASPPAWTIMEVYCLDLLLILLFRTHDKRVRARVVVVVGVGTTYAHTCSKKENANTSDL